MSALFLYASVRVRCTSLIEGKWLDRMILINGENPSV